MTITSPHNDQLKEIRKLAGRKWRDKLRQFVAEGSGLEGEEVKPHLLAQVSQLGSGTRALGVYGQRWASEATGPLCLALWGVNDPGNVGTALRGALAFGAGSVALGPGTADPFGPKAVRASMGAIFRVGVVRARDVAGLPAPRVALAAGEAAIAAAASTDALEGVRVAHLGRKAELPNLLRGVAELPADERGEVGRAANQARQALEALIAGRAAEPEA